MSTGPVATKTEKIGPRELRVVWLLLAATFVAFLNETTMGVALKPVADDLGVTEVDAQWLTTAFMLTMAVVIPITGFLLQRISTRQVFITAMILFSTGTLLALVSPNFSILVVARVIQASGTAIMMPLLMTTLMTVVPPSQRGRMMGRVSIVMSLSPAIGPAMSGYLSDHFSWRANFAVVLPIAIIAMVAGAKWITNLGEKSKASLDVLSIVLSAVGFGGLVYGLSQIGAAAHGAESGAGSSLPLIIALVVGGVGLVLFISRQLQLQKRDAALLDLRVFRSRNFALSVGQLALMSIAFFGVITVLPLYMQTAAGLSATESGLAILPGALAMAGLGPVIGRIYDSRGTRTLLIPGAVITIGMLWFFTTFDQNTSLLVITIGQTIMCVGLAMSFTPLFTASLASVQPEMYSHGSAVVATIQQVAGAAGIAVMITIMSGVRDAALAAGESMAVASAMGSHMTFLVGACIATPLIIGAMLIRKPADTPEGIVAH